jgi:hypothetical protein
MLDDTFRFAIITPAPEVVRLIEEANGTVVPLKTDDISNSSRLSQPMT